MKSIEMSGFGDDYEAACQRMLIVGLAYLKENPNDEYEFKQSKNIIGVISPENNKAKDLTVAIVKPVPDCSGAMVQAVINHLMYIKRNGYDQWLVDGAGRVVDVNEETGSILR